MRERARRKIVEAYSLDRTVQANVGMYRELLNLERRPDPLPAGRVSV
jgi:hypothetical protein